MRRLVPLLALLLFTTGGLHAQDLEETLRTLSQEYAQAYTQPLADALGANLNTGLYRDAAVGRGLLGVNLYVGVRAFGAFLPPESETFDLVFSGRVSLDAQVGGQTYRVSVPASFEVRDAPTLFGPEAPAVATVTARYDTTITRFGIRVPVSFDTTLTREIVGGLLQTSIVPTAAPQLRIGTFFGTDVMLRYLPRIEVTDVGAVEMRGAGIRHSISQYLPLLPLDVAVQATWQQINAEDAAGNELLNASTFAASVAVSKRFGPLVLYGGVQRERAALDVSYDLDVSDEIEPVPIRYTLVGSVRARGTVGAGLNLGPLRLHGDYSIGEVNVASVGLGLGF